MPPIFPVDNGPDYSSNGTTANARFIPEVWSGKLQVKFYKSTVLSEITNNDWEGEIKGHGDKVVIRKTPDITVSDYAKNKALTPTMPDTTSLELLIDKGKYFNVILDDVNAVQSDLKLMDNFTNDAAEQMKIKIDAVVLNHPPGSPTAAWSSVVVAGNKGDTAGVVSGKINLGKTAAPLIPANATAAGSLSGATCNP